MELIANMDEDTYEPMYLDSVDFYLPPGKYRFTLKDRDGDGFCCSNGNGSYALSLDGRELVRGDVFNSEITYNILVGHEPTMSSRDMAWLNSHNTRRKTWHERNGKEYVPLLWSDTLASDASSRARALLSECDSAGVSASNSAEGENVFKEKKASGSSSLGNFYPPETILKKWVDNEESLGYPQNDRLTQA